MGRKAATVTGSTYIMTPLKGVSAIDQNGKAFDDAVARQELYDGIRATRGNSVPVELDNHINDLAFAEAVAQKLMNLMQI